MQTSQNEQLRQQVNATLILKQPDPSSIHTHDGCPLTHKITIADFHKPNLSTFINENHLPNIPPDSFQSPEIKQKTYIYQHESTRVKMSPAHVPKSKTTLFIWHYAVSILNPTLNTQESL
jgi:hypothetical protein